MTQTFPPSPRAISRRAVVAGLLAGAALAHAPGALAAPSPPSGSGTRPNILFIMADDMGFADLSCYGRREYKTPVLDQLAAEGMRFTQAYANSAVCTATRVALITGRYQYRLPVGLEEPLGLRDVGLPPEQPTMASLLRGAGYHTSLVGKWHMGSLPKYGPLKSGYDQFWGIRQGGVDYFTHKIGGFPDLWDGETPVEETGYLTQLLAERTIEALEERAREDTPWLISLHLTAPHWPWEGPEDHAESARLAAKGGFSIAHYDGGSMDTYAAMVTSMDEQIGRVLDRLAQLGLAEDTLVVFTSDNGGERFSDTWPFTGKKTELLEGGLRIPAIVRWPGVTPPASTSAAQIMSMDWMPTFLAAAGAAPDPASPSDGRDLRGALEGREFPERALFWRFRNHDQMAAREGRWKYLSIAGNSFLFDVEADPLERANLKERHPETFARLRAAWEAWNAKMLPNDPEAASYGFTGEMLADHFGIDS
ncbi:sulfatase [Novosphingobium mangrovi (ex Hu et al. 2023)]|uniref:Sulfatase-like hydrolase/transferase n=1 Tax=Novosphingobium mangrovi (ex Hu et al. 2023) TaxID=2930094 RepID=A0ABT0AAI8_9SPHN|nr:sulfatase-like hydrolase/transferase [Novosphingobium mangrovi (ex Hu et al. 2023)]MCJ1960208.1 sulfatase-like hydrolase/transferase [Novosphingobium mangrovi (ex Hu et al. 2023)]